MIDYDAIAVGYALHRQVHPGVLGELITKSHVNAQSQVLEVGCGTGNYIGAIQAAVGCRCYGIDPSTPMLAQAGVRSPGVEFQIGHAEALNQSAGVFDLVFSVDVIHHIGRRDRYFHEACRTLKPGGWLCTATDSEYVIRHRQPLSEYFPETIIAELQRYPPISSLCAGMKQVGLADIAEDLVEFSYLLTDCNAYKAKAYSALHLISQAAFERGIARMELDLQAGPIQCVSRYVMLWARKLLDL